jgi:hypothetical protein
LEFKWLISCTVRHGRDTHTKRPCDVRTAAGLQQQAHHFRREPRISFDRTSENTLSRSIIVGLLGLYDAGLLPFDARYLVGETDTSSVEK